jgi:hypothetical protein
MANSPDLATGAINTFVRHKILQERESNTKLYYTFVIDDAHSSGEYYEVAQFNDIEDIFKYINRERDLNHDLEQIIQARSTGEHPVSEEDQEQLENDIQQFYMQCKGANRRGGLEGVRNQFTYITNEYYEDSMWLLARTPIDMPNIYIMCKPIDPTLKIYMRYQPDMNNRRSAVYTKNLISHGNWPLIENTGAGGAGAGSRGGKHRKKSGRTRRLRQTRRTRRLRRTKRKH